MHAVNLITKPELSRAAMVSVEQLAEAVTAELLVVSKVSGNYHINKSEILMARRGTAVELREPGSTRKSQNIATLFAT